MLPKTFKMNMNLSAVTPLPLLGLLIFTAAGIAYAATPYMGAASFAYFLMVAGIFYRRRHRGKHRALMISAMSIDLGLVLLLEFQRGAIGTVISLEMGALPLAHVAFSTAALLLYGPLIFLGRALWAGQKARTWHRRLGLTAFALRSLGFLLMFSLLGGKN